MTTCWTPETDSTPSPRDVLHMASVLEGQHGSYAADVAEFFASAHVERGDVSRSWAWIGVADLIKDRERMRLERD